MSDHPEATESQRRMARDLVVPVAAMMHTDVQLGRIAVEVLKYGNVAAAREIFEAWLAELDRQWPFARPSE